jgi:hypothetical protein
MVKQRRFLPAIVFLLVGLILYSHVTSAHAQAVAQGYGSTNSLQIGMMVRVDPTNTSDVETITQATAGKLLGVVVAPNDVPASLSQNSSGQQFYVATSGAYQVLVSDQNGPVKAGNYVVASSLAGVGMEQDNTQPTVVGIAKTSFTGKGNGILGTASLKGANGKSQTVQLGYVTVTLSIASNPQLRHATATIVTGLPNFLQKASQSVVNKPVSYTRAYLSFGVLIISAIIAGSVLYAGVRNGMVAVGRNPLARKSIMHNLLEVIFTSLIIFVIGIFAVYLLLKL